MGGIGRGEHESFCILFADPESERARIRLEAVVRERDGFELAEVDLNLRGEGEVLGTRQSGHAALPGREPSPTTPELLVEARADLIGLLAHHDSLDAPELGPLLDAARVRFGDERVERLAA